MLPIKERDQRLGMLADTAVLSTCTVMKDKTEFAIGEDFDISMKLWFVGLIKYCHDLPNNQIVLTAWMDSILEIYNYRLRAPVKNFYGYKPKREA